MPIERQLKMDSLKKDIKDILKEAGVDKPTRVVNQIMKVIESKDCDLAKEEIVETSGEPEKEGGIHRNPNNYIHKIKPRNGKKMKEDGTPVNAITSIEIPNTDNKPDLDLSQTDHNGNKNAR